MKTEQLKPILHDLNSHLVNILVKLEPELKNHHGAKNPSFQGARFFIEKALPLLNRAGETEIKQLNELAKNAKEKLKLQNNSKIFAICYVFLNSATVDQVQYDFDFRQIVAFLRKTYYQIGIKTRWSKTYSSFSYIMIDQQIDGFTKNTYSRFAAEKNINGEIIIYEVQNPNPNEPDLLADMDNELSYSRKEIIDAAKNEWGRDYLFNKCREIEKEFAEYANEVSMEYKNLIETFETLENILKSEIEIRKSSRPASFIRLPFDEKKNQEIIDFLFKELNGLCFNTTKENFTKIFNPDRTFTKIKWLWKSNALVQLFTGFNFNFDGFQFEFPNLMLKNSNKWIILVDKFHFDFNGKATTPAQHLAKLKRRNQRPNELKIILPILEVLKKGYYK
jgi:hypothetical protein